MTTQSQSVVSLADLRQTVERLAMTTPVTDMHTHLYAPEFGDLLLWGIDELLTYHYLISESFRWSEEEYSHFWSLTKREQADWIWKLLFIDHSPLSEAATGFITILKRLGLDVSSRNLDDYREALSRRTVQEQVDTVMQISGVSKIVMTNDPFDSVERPVWLADQGKSDPRFYAALRVDALLNDWPHAVKELQKLGYDVQTEWSQRTKEETRRFLSEWIIRMDALYLAVSMPGDFVYPADDHRSKMIDDVMVPVCGERNIPFALMIGVRRRVNPSLGLAGDMSMRSDVTAVEALCRRYPEQKFLITMLARENQHELTVLARKFRNLMIFGCWWFLHIESMVEEMTRFRVELLGTSMIPQHSDCRVFEQLIYKWEHSRRIIGSVLADKYEKLHHSGWSVTEEEIQRDLDDMLNQNFWRFLGKEHK
ncbi:glucuronate isomerase [Paenibacillus radicis (ex Gao et al. 2016)]|uniref:Glucuronate isomerase n=1 Tax=Paenibacillus radicis (ex Gao et al. 2016) TaxID=1737354 RepID=A0A917GPY4_9BACL|nr:glucuronate isomerase [Paenibacillus radicis (ex Gao et al. 2016)]GGG53881.1 glucuronate isomerase [Paenibacillus radicis (ex Gao et al. 2016)]